MMTRKDYVATAEILHSFRPLIEEESTFRDLVFDFASMFQIDNPRFSPSTFHNACYNGKN